MVVGATVYGGTSASKVIGLENKYKIDTWELLGLSEGESRGLYKEVRRRLVRLWGL